MMRRIWNHITLAFLQLALSATIGFTSCSQGKAEKKLTLCLLLEHYMAIGQQQDELHSKAPH